MATQNRHIQAYTMPTIAHAQFAAAILILRGYTDITTRNEGITMAAFKDEEDPYWKVVDDLIAEVFVMQWTPVVNKQNELRKLADSMLG
jgi:hypothetical protein